MKGKKVYTYNSKTFLKFIYLQIKSLKKVIILHETFLKLLDDLNEKLFCKEDNEQKVKDIIKNSLYVFHNNICTVLKAKVNEINMFTVSTTNETLNGINLICVCKSKEMIKHELSVFNESMRIEYNTTYDMIKVIFNNRCNEPNDIFFIGYRDKSDLSTYVKKVYESIKNSISNFKVLELTKIIIYNNFQKII